METKNHAIIFARVSSEDQRDGFSLDAQVSLAQKYAKEKGLKIIRIWKVQESASKEDSRKKFFEMIKYIQENNIKHAVFDKVDRAVRGLRAAAEIEQLIRENEVSFHFPRENLILNQESLPQEKFRFSLGTVIAKYYIDNLKTEINKGLNQRTENGYWNGLAPFGYSNVRQNGRAILEVNPFEAGLVRDVFSFYSTGNYTYQMLADYIQTKLQEVGPDESRSCTKRLIETILTNPIYYGMMRVRKKLYKGKHEPLINKELFDSCQKIRGIRSQQYKSNRKGIIVKPFMGFLTCGCCGHAITGETAVKNSEKKYTYYRCANHKCIEHKKRINETDLLRQLIFAFEPFAKWTPKATDAFIELLQGQIEKAELFTGELETKVARAREEVRERVNQLSELKNKGLLSAKEFEAAVGVSNQLLQQHKLEIDQIRTSNLATFKVAASIIQMFRRAYDFMQLPGNELEKVRLAKLVLSNPTLSDRTMRYDYKKPLDELFNLTERPIWWRRGELNPRPQVIHEKALHT